MMIPVHSTLIPLFSLFLKVGLTDHPLSVILSYAAFNLPITIMILLGFYYALPKEVEEAAIMDGCSIHRMFFRIILPMTASVLSTTAIINMIYNWNEFIFVNTFIRLGSLQNADGRRPELHRPVYDRLGRDRRDADDQHFADSARLLHHEQPHCGRHRRRIGQRLK